MWEGAPDSPSVARDARGEWLKYPTPVGEPLTVDEGWGQDARRKPYLRDWGGGGEKEAYITLYIK